MASNLSIAGLFLKPKKMKHYILFLLFLVFIQISTAQKLSLETNVSKSLSGFGDMWGTIIDAGIKFQLKSGYYSKFTYGIGHATSNTFTESELKSQINLLILDEWTQNYPYLYIQESFDVGTQHHLPSTNFQTYNIAKIIIGRDFNLGTRLTLGLDFGISYLKVENTYITAQVPAKITNIFYGEIDGIITVPHILSFDDYPLNFGLDFKCKVTKNFKSGIFLNLNEGDIRITSAGIKLTAAIME